MRHDENPQKRQVAASKARLLLLACAVVLFGGCSRPPRSQLRQASCQIQCADLEADNRWRCFDRCTVEPR